MVVFVVKGHVQRSCSFAGRICKIVSKYSCKIDVNINGRNISANDRLMRWVTIFDDMVQTLCSTLTIRINGEKERELAGELISCIWNFHDEENHLILIMPNNNMIQEQENGIDDYADEDYRRICIEAYQTAAGLHCPMCGILLDNDSEMCPACGWNHDNQGDTYWFNNFR